MSISGTQKRRGRPATGQTPHATLRLPAELREGIDAWIAQQPDPKPSRSEAIRRLLEIGLRATAEATVPGIGPGPSREESRSEAGPDNRDTIRFGGQVQKVGSRRRKVTLGEPEDPDEQ